MRDDAKYGIGALLGAALTAAGFLVSGRDDAPRADRPDADAIAAEARDGSAARAAGREGGGSDSSGARLLGSQRPPTADESAYLERALQEERRRRAAAVIRREDTGLDVLRRVLDEKSDPSDLLADFDQFASHVAHAEGKTMSWKGADGVTKVSRNDAAGAVVLEFGPGTFVLDRGRQAWGDFREGVKSLEVRGAGMAATTIRCPDEKLIFAQKGIESLRLAGLTWDAVYNQGGVLDARGDVAIACDDVRFRRNAANGSDPFYLEGRSYLGFRRCVFDGETMGTAVRLRGDTVALFKECSFLDVSSVIGIDSGTARGGIVRFEDCGFEGARLADKWSMLYRGQPAVALVLHGGHVAFGEAALSEARRRDDWGASFVATLEGTAFGPDPSTPTLADLIRVLAGVTRETKLTPMDVRLRIPGRGTRAASYAVGSWDPGAKKAVASLVTVDASGIHVAADPNGHTNEVTQAAVAASRPLVDVLSASSVPRDMATHGAYLFSWWAVDKPVLAVHIESDDWPGWMLDPTTGEALSRPDPTRAK